jgi:hypothetical protein
MVQWRHKQWCCWKCTYLMLQLWSVLAVSNSSLSVYRDAVYQVSQYHTAPIYSLLIKCSTADIAARVAQSVQQWSRIAQCVVLRNLRYQHFPQQRSFQVVIYPYAVSDRCCCAAVDIVVDFLRWTIACTVPHTRHTCHKYVALICQDSSETTTTLYIYCFFACSQWQLCWL